MKISTTYKIYKAMRKTNESLGKFPWWPFIMLVALTTVVYICWLAKEGLF